MEGFKKYLKKSFWVISIFALVIAACINLVIYNGIKWNVNDLQTAITLISDNYYLWVMPLSTGLCLATGWLLWFVLTNLISRAFSGITLTEKVMKTNSRSKKDFLEQKIEQDRKRRLFLHSLSVLQRDGRLLDFFDEDLSLYDDEQIGAAVRSVQEDCKKTIKKYIDLKPVMDSEEGELVKIELGFDIDSIKLVGNVSGEPPFEGVLKHRGWKAGKKEIPKLSNVQDAGIIVPAEIEIQ